MAKNTNRLVNRAARRDKPVRSEGAYKPKAWVSISATVIVLVLILGAALVSSLGS